MSSTEGDFTRGHVDGVARFIDQDTVVVGRFADQNDADAQVYEEPAAIIADAGFKVVRMNIPGRVRYRGVQMAATYLNWLVANDGVVVNGCGHPAWDEPLRRRWSGTSPTGMFTLWTRASFGTGAAGLIALLTTSPRVPLALRAKPAACYLRLNVIRCCFLFCANIFLE